MAPYQIHNVRFFDLKPRSAHSMAYCEELKLLALSRADTYIEIWNFSNLNAPVLERSISGNASEGSIEALAWAKKSSKNKSNGRDWRLFSTGLHGLVIEHKLQLEEEDNNDDIYRSQSRTSWPVTSGATWCMKFNQVTGKLALGTEEGYICLFTVSDDGLDFDKVLDKQEGRILCLDWHSEGKHIVTGSPDTLRLWDVVSGHPLLRMSTGRTERNRETIVWSVGIMDDFTIVSGDSRGKTSFWNGRTGTLVDSYQSHKADVLAVAVSQDQQIVYSIGVDPVLMQFQPVVKNSSEQRRKWVKSIHRTTNTHDVRAIVCIGNKKVVTVGVDANLCITGAGSNVVKIPPIPWGENVVVGTDANVIAFRKQTSVVLWKLGKAHASNVSNVDGLQNQVGKILALQDHPVKLLEIQTHDEDIIENFHMSSNGDYIAYVTATKIRVFKVDLSENEAPKIKRVDLTLKPRKIPHILHFCRHNSTDFLLTATVGLGLKCYQMSLEDDSATPIFRLSPKQMDFKSDISKIATNSNGTFAVVADHDDTLVSVDLSTERVTCRFPDYGPAKITCFAIHPRTDNVVIAYADGRFVECSSETGKYTKFSSNFLTDETFSNLIPKQFMNKPFPTLGIVFPRSQKKTYEDSIIFYDVDKIFVFDKSTLTKEKLDALAKATKTVKLSNGTSTKAVIPKQQLAMTITKKYEHLVHLASVENEVARGDDATPTLVAVEVRAESIESQLPPSLRQKKFGAM